MMTSNDLQLDRWDIVVAPFPFTDIVYGKPRPVAVLSNAAFNKAHGHAITAMITTGAGSRWDSDHIIVDLAPTGLKHASLLRWKLVTLSLTIIPRKIGTLGQVDRGLLTAKLAGILLG
jgi:mRNA interferase MazF